MSFCSFVIQSHIRIRIDYFAELTKKSWLEAFSSYSFGGYYQLRIDHSLVARNDKKRNGMPSVLPLNL